VYSHDPENLFTGSELMKYSYCSFPFFGIFNLTATFVAEPSFSTKLILPSIVPEKLAIAVIGF